MDATGREEAKSTRKPDAVYVSSFFKRPATRPNSLFHGGWVYGQLQVLRFWINCASAITIFRKRAKMLFFQVRGDFDSTKPRINTEW